ncbi:MAG: hypothetical protein HYZ74_06290, partial [Elusimicrobia bacterium]|nr:hypothetical protein [Elusimicrobiota bacterium]
LSLKHARFRYKGDSTKHEGLIYEDSPESIHAPGEAISLDQRVVNLEMALKDRLRKIRELEERLRMLKERP